MTEEKKHTAEEQVDTLNDADFCEGVFDHEPPRIFPEEPIDRVIDPLKHFVHIESAGGIVLLVMAAFALLLAISPAAGRFLSLWETHAGFRIGGLFIDISLQH